jgi:hypothetical protein
MFIWLSCLVQFCYMQALLTITKLKNHQVSTRKIISIVIKYKKPIQDNKMSHMMVLCIYINIYIYTHYIHSVVVQDFVSGRACCVNQYHYESLSVHATGKTWYKILYQHTMYVISLSNISIKTNFKQITRVELKFVQYSQGDYILCMTSRYLFRSFTNARIVCFVSHSNDMTSSQSSSAENVSCNITPFFYHHSVVMQHLVSDRLLSLISKENVHNVR